MEPQGKGHDFRAPSKGEAEDTRVDALPPMCAEVAFVVRPEAAALTAEKGLRLKNSDFSLNPLGVPASPTDLSPLRGPRVKTVIAPASPITSPYSPVVPVARRSLSETVGCRFLARQFSPERRDQSRPASTPYRSSCSQSQHSSAGRASSSGMECRETAPQLGTRSLDPFYDVTSPASPQYDLCGSLQPRVASTSDDNEQPQFSQATSSWSRIAAARFSATTTVSGHEANSAIEQCDEGAVPMLQSRGMLIPRSLGPRRETPRPLRDDETTEASADPEERPDIVPTRGSVSANGLPELGGPRPTSLFNDAYAEDPYAAARMPWVTLAVLYLQAQAHWNFLHKYYPGRCASVNTILLERQWERVVFAAFHHADVNHLTCGMFFFFFKGILIEAALGPTHFVALLAVVMLLVGLVNAFSVLVFCELSCESSVCGMCMYTLAGVVVALDMVIRRYLGHARIYYGGREFHTRPRVCFMFELFVLFSCSEKNLIPICCGYLAGAFLCRTKLGRLIVSIPKLPRHIYLCVVPYAPVTYLLFSALVVAFLCGPYPDTSTSADSTLTFRDPVWKPPILSALYLEDAYQVAYVGLSLLAVGQNLERELGHYRFLCLATGFLLAGHLLPDGLSWILCKYAVAFRGEVPAVVPHASAPFSCSSILVGTLLALKTIHHQKHRDSGYQVALFTVPVPFWAGIVLELAHLHFSISDASTAVHVMGVIAGLIIAYCRDGGCCFLSRIQKVSRRSSSCSVLVDAEDEAPSAQAPSPSANIWCQVCASRAASPTAYRVPETTTYREPEVPAEDDAPSEDQLTGLADTAVDVA